MSDLSLTLHQTSGDPLTHFVKYKSCPFSLDHSSCLLHFNHVSTTRRKLLHNQQTTRFRRDTPRYHLQWRKRRLDCYQVCVCIHSRGPSLVGLEIRVDVLIITRSGSSLTISAARPKPSLLRMPPASRLVMMALMRSRSSLLLGMIGPSLGKTTYIRLYFRQCLRFVH